VKIKGMEVRSTEPTRSSSEEKLDDVFDEEIMSLLLEDEIWGQ
jgi:predicted PilT family ATPase